MKILTIEDNPDIKEVLDLILISEGYETVYCSDGSSLAELDHLKPNLILMDEILAGTRGSDLVKMLKENEKTRSIPVILISAMPDLEKIAEKCGADAYLEKPFNIDTLTDLIKNFI